MLPRTSTTSNQSRLRRERDAVAIADSMASETDLLELPTTSVFTYVWLAVIGLSLLCVRVILCKEGSTAGTTGAPVAPSRPGTRDQAGRPAEHGGLATVPAPPPPAGSRMIHPRWP